jgi:Patatin-like phospholipase
MSVKKFHEIFALEVEAINVRRKGKRPEVKLEEESRLRDGTPVMRPAADSKTVGLALSGGGIRSAAFCLGALQALDERRVIEKIDYLSSVSGGGYIGISMTAAMSVDATGKFPFASRLRAGEEPGVQHIRDHSNYLFPQGSLNLFGNIVVYLRGIFANVVLLLPWLLLAAALTICLYPDAGGLAANNFRSTLVALLVFVVLLALWALWRSTPWGRNISDVGFGARCYGILLVLILVVAFLELQPWVLSGMFAVADAPGGVSSFFGKAAGWLKVVAASFASIGTVVGFLGSFLADTLKRTTEKPGLAAFATRIAIKLAMYVAGAAVPLVLWLAYLYLSFWGMADAASPHAPAWLKTVAEWMPRGGGKIVNLYWVTGVVLLVIGACLSANANSLHRLYRDRLSKAFLFDPDQRMTARGWFRRRGGSGAETDRALRNSDLLPLDQFRVGDLKTDRTPYHLINAALNIEASKYANRRGRNADFFIFSPLFTGAEATGYVETARMQEKVTGFTAGTAMAVSGAAASSNMGSATVKPLVPTLAILNVRLGYWLTNPGRIAGNLKKSLIPRLFDRLYFFKELLGLLSDDSETVYITDGGHIENLGIYELLRRRCKLIIAVDAEADPEMSFGSLVTLERYARIDFGLRIDLPWDALRNASRAASAEILENGFLPPDAAQNGPHCALGTIYYPRKGGVKDDANSTGLLLYVKSSFTGDEDDYIMDYKRRNPDFPHETTVDQFFTEEQFEVYRALGFHAVNSAFKNTDKVAMRPDPAQWQGPNTTLPLEKAMLDILG